MQAGLLTEESTPEALRDRQEEMAPAFETLQTLTAELKGHCDAGDWVSYRNTAEALYMAVTAFEATFL
jgi:hypothetical protein